MSTKGLLPKGQPGPRAQARDIGLIHGRGPKPPQGRGVPCNHSLREELIVLREGVLLRSLEGLSTLVRVDWVFQEGERVQRGSGAEDWCRGGLALDVQLHGLMDREGAFAGDPELGDQGKKQGVHEDEVPPAAARAAIGSKASGSGPAQRCPGRVRAKVRPSRKQLQGTRRGEVLQLGVEVAQDGHVGVSPLHYFLPRSNNDGIGAPGLMFVLVASRESVDAVDCDGDMMSRA
jgi:hypothetical protein